MAIDLEGVDRDGRDADAQGKRKDELQFTLEQWSQDGASDEAFGVSDGTQGQGQSNAIITTVVEGMEARVNRDNDDDKRYLPMSMGYRDCYKRYLASLDILTCGVQHLGCLFWGNERTEKPWTPVTLSLFQHTFISGRQASQSLR